MRKKKQYATIHKIDNDTITLKINNSSSATARKALPRGVVKATLLPESMISVYRKSSQHKRGVLGIKYTPSYYVGDAHIRKTSDPNQFSIKKSHIKGSKLSIGDVVVVEVRDSEKKQGNESF